MWFLIQGFGTNDDTLIRVIVSRCEVDMVQIKQEFHRAHGQTLEAFIEVLLLICGSIFRFFYRVIPRKVKTNLKKSAIIDYILFNFGTVLLSSKIKEFNKKIF